MDFKRRLSIQEYNSWLGVLNMLKDCALTDNKADCVQWALDKKKHYFTTKSLYWFLTDRGCHWQSSWVYLEVQGSFEDQIFLMENA